MQQVEADFPYFQVVQVLLARSLSNEKHYDFNRRIQRTAISVPDREVLYRYLHDEPVVQEAMNEMLSVPAISEVSVSEPDMPVVPVATVTLPEPEPVEAEPLVLNEVILEPVFAEEPEEVAERSIIPEPEQEVIIEPVTAPETKPLATDPNETHTFAEWLQLKKQGQPQVTKTMHEPLLKEAKPELVKEVIQPSVEEEKADHLDQKKESSNIKDFESILDRFIKESPTISRPKAEFYNPANMAKQSVEEDEDLVTETLAKLYVHQGHYRKAIRAYEKLCLIYPHKMAYFADLIQKLKAENKD